MNFYILYFFWQWNCHSKNNQNYESQFVVSTRDRSIYRTIDVIGRYPIYRTIRYN